MNEGPESIDSQIQSLMNAADSNRWMVGFHSDAVELTATAMQLPSSVPGLKGWLIDALRVAMRIEMTVIPPYLVALWSIKAATGVQRLIADVAKEEMLHLGLVCNCLASLGDNPPLANSDFVPTFPAELPLFILPDLKIQIASYSDSLIRNVFVPIEQPSDALFRWDNGFRFWTIGAFYGLLERMLRISPESWFSDRNQFILPDIKLTSVTDPKLASAAMKLIRVQGEGTPGPLFGPNQDEDVAHFFRFWEIIKGREIEVHDDGTWSFTGPEISKPRPDQVFQITQMANPSHPASIAFDATYSEMLDLLASAWEAGSSNEMRDARDRMTVLSDKALDIFKQTLNETTGECHGPRFSFN